MPSRAQSFPLSRSMELFEMIRVRVSVSPNPNPLTVQLELVEMIHNKMVESQ